MTFTTFLRTLASPITSLVIRPASAHCDTADGPAVVDGRRALSQGNVNIALKWVMSEGEDELRAAFDRAQRVRAVGGEAAALAEQWFLENMVRIHRAGEGAGVGIAVGEIDEEGHDHQPAEAEDQPADDVADGAEADHGRGTPSRPLPSQTGQPGRAAVRIRRVSAWSAS